MADFQQHLGDFEAINTKIVAGSTDPVEEARKTIERHDITFPVAHGLDHEAVSATTGAYMDPNRKCLHATGFIIRPEGTVGGVVYSSGAVGRYAAADVIGLIRYLSK